MDGTSLQEISKNKKITAISIDTKGKRIFYADDGGEIISSSYEGKSRRIFMESTVKNIKTLTFYENHLFFLHSLNSFSNVSRKILTLWSCKFDGEICKDPKQLPGPIQDPAVIKAPSVSSFTENPCKINNGNCSHLCLLSSKKSNSCACRTGYQLDSDLTGCHLVGDVILYIENSYIKGIPLNSRQYDTFKDVIVPTRLSPGNWYLGLNYNYDKQSDNFYFYGQGEIKVMSILNEGKTKALIKRIKISDNLVFDKLSSNFYFIDDDSDNLKIIHSKPNRTLNKNILAAHKIDHFTVNENLGKIFFTVKSDGLYSINTDGTNLKNLSTDSQLYGNVIGSAWDLDNSIYFFDKEKIFYKNFQDFNAEIINFDVPIKNPKSISVYQKFLYISNSTSIWRMNKKTGKNVNQVFKNTGKRLITTFTVLNTYSSDYKMDKECIVIDEESNTITQYEYVENECARNNGDCEHFCFSKPQKTCGCIDGYQLKNNGTCIKVK